MPTTIPYDSSLVLGNLIDDTKIEKLKAIANLQKPADDAETKLNSLITIKHKLDMTLQEMLNLGVEDLTEYSSQQLDCEAIEIDGEPVEPKSDKTDADMQKDSFLTVYEQIFKSDFFTVFLVSRSFFWFFYKRNNLFFVFYIYSMWKLLYF